ncbi:hypothetical protein BAE44_0021394 [Dichanthelium oligosanthes]|uniref:Uncharacterized protein n=1 Tax=Dichanthelium oligosanthes TaxID=888268 RepID=A0A1E5UXJ1_9POAL|nr:hypothetical protein BAE44_0021394 [Dichanthelium oligosanthes]
MAPPPPPELMDELIGEILLRLPPYEPEHLFRAALVCKPWLRILCDPAFRRRYCVFHGAPPLLGLLHGAPPAARFASTTSMPDFPHPGSDNCRARPLDCRHGRVLIHMLKDDGADLLVWDPVTGDRHDVPEPDMDWLIYTAAVFCAADGCDHLDCHGGPFRVVFVATDDREEIVKASAYSSETGAWTAPVSLDDSCECYVQHKRDALAARPWYTPYVQPRRGAAIGDEIYFTLRWGNDIIMYNLPNNCLSMISPPSHNAYEIALMVMDDSSLGFASSESSSLYLWSREVNPKGAAEWVQRRVIELETIIPVVNPSHEPFVVGSAEGVGVIFISTDAGLFTIDLKSGRVRKVDEPGVYFSVLPYMSFYTPVGTNSSQSAAVGFFQSY